MNGVKTRVEKLCQAFENGKELVELSQASPHDISNVLKLYLRQVSPMGEEQILGRTCAWQGRGFLGLWAARPGMWPGQEIWLWVGVGPAPGRGRADARGMAREGQEGTGPGSLMTPPIPTPPAPTCHLTAA